MIDFPKKGQKFLSAVPVGILPMASYRNAEFIHNNIPGMSIPELIRECMRRTDCPIGGRPDCHRIAVGDVTTRRWDIDHAPPGVTTRWPPRSSRHGVKTTASAHPSLGQPSGGLQAAIRSRIRNQGTAAWSRLYSRTFSITSPATSVSRNSRPECR